MIYRIRHTTSYDYGEPVSLCHNLVHLRPRSDPFQSTDEYRLTVEPEPAVLDESLDYFGNPVAHFTLQEPHRKLRVTATHRTEIVPRPVHEPAATPPWEAARDAIRRAETPEMLDALQYTFDSHYVPRGAELAEYARPSFAAGRPLLDGVLDLTRRIHADFAYDPKSTTITTPPAEVLAVRRGVCQDFAHLQIGSLRSLGLAARYISGYLMTTAEAGAIRLVGADASHAWLAVCIPGFGWVPVDPTNGILPGDRHILLAWGRDYDDVSPIKGVIVGDGPHTMSVGVDVVPEGN